MKAVPFAPFQRRQKRVEKKPVSWSGKQLNCLQDGFHSQPKKGTKPPNFDKVRGWKQRSNCEDHHGDVEQKKYHLNSVPKRQQILEHASCILVARIRTMTWSLATVYHPWNRQESMAAVPKWRKRKWGSSNPCRRKRDHSNHGNPNGHTHTHRQTQHSKNFQIAASPAKFSSLTHKKKLHTCNPIP